MLPLCTASCSDYILTIYVLFWLYNIHTDSWPEIRDSMAPAHAHWIKLTYTVNWTYLTCFRLYYEIGESNESSMHKSEIKVYTLCSFEYAVWVTHITRVKLFLLLVCIWSSFGPLELEIIVPPVANVSIITEVFCFCWIISRREMFKEDIQAVWVRLFQKLEKFS